MANIDEILFKKENPNLSRKEIILKYAEYCDDY